jgi:transcriptional regulator with XRE-family HTH domain
MEHDAWTPTDTIARRVREVREERHLTAAQLAERLTAVGVAWDRNTVTKLETGRRANVSVAELLALAVVLEVAPMHLLVPLKDEQPYAVTPGRVEAARWVRSFVRGSAPLDGIDPRRFYSQVPAGEWEFSEAFREGDEDGQVRALREEMQRLREEMQAHRRGPWASDG